jgi:CPA1 family monovalent cation:H+ antiporter
VHESHLLLLLIGSLAVTAVCRKRGWPAPLVLVAVGLAISTVPGFPKVELDSDLVLSVALPPLLYSAALRCSYTGFRASIGTITALGVGLVAVTTVAVGLVAYLIVPDMPLAVAFVLGAVVAPPDAVAATAIGRRLGLPRRVVMVLTGESLINDGTALTLYKVALAAALGATTGLLHGIGVFAWTTAAGVALGLGFGWLVCWVRRHVQDPVIGTVFGLLTPFVAYLVGEEIGASGVLAVVAAGLFVGQRLPELGAAARLQEEPVWEALDALLEAVVFGLIGIQLRFVVDAVAGSPYGLGKVTVAAVIVLVVAIGVRIASVFSLGALVRALQRRGRARRVPPPARKSMAVVSWAGMRGVVTLAVAAAIPLTMDDGSPFPDRAAVQLIAFVVTIGTLLVQGLTLPWLIRRLHADDPDERARDAEAAAELYALTTDAALARLGEVRAEWPEQHRPLLDRLAAVIRSQGRAAVDAARARVEEGVEEAEDETAAPDAAPQLPDEIYRVRQDLLGVQRRALLGARDRGDLDDEVMREVLHWLDLEEAALMSARPDDA